MRSVKISVSSKLDTDLSSAWLQTPQRGKPSTQLTKQPYSKRRKRTSRRAGVRQCGITGNRKLLGSPVRAAPLVTTIDKAPRTRRPLSRPSPKTCESRTSTAQKASNHRTSPNTPCEEEELKDAAHASPPGRENRTSPRREDECIPWNDNTAATTKSASSGEEGEGLGTPWSCWRLWRKSTFWETKCGRVRRG